MDLSYDILLAPKEGSEIADYEDAYAFSPDFSVTAVADGAGDAFESRQWARLLAKAFVERPPFGLAEDGMIGWTGQVSAEWAARIPWQTLDYYEGERAAEGSAATLVGLHIDEAAPGNGRWQCVAIGDSCMFQVSAGRLVQCIPIESSQEFNSHPPLLYTRPEDTVNSIGELVKRAGTWQAGDRFFLLTDAISEWFLREAERGHRPWDELASLDQWSFPSFINDGRRRGLIRNDDVTVFILNSDVPAVTEETPVIITGLPPVLTPEPVPAGSGGPPNGPGVPTADDGGPGAAPPWQGTPSRSPDPAPSLARRRTTVLIGALVLGLLAGFLIGRAIGGSSSPRATPTPTPAPTQAPAVALDKEASGFANALVASHGNLGAYESTLDAFTTPYLQHSLPRMLHLQAKEFRSVVSQGHVESLALAKETATTAHVDVIVYRTLTVAGAHPVSQYLLVDLELTRPAAKAGSTGKWKVSAVALLPSANRLFPPQVHSKRAATKGSSTKPANHH